MKIPRFTIILFIFLIVTVAVIALYGSKQFFLNKFKVFLVERIESSTPAGIKIEVINYVPLKGIRLAGVSVYKDNLYKEKTFYISHLYIKFPLMELLADKTFSPTIIIDRLKLGNVVINGRVGFSMKLAKKAKTAEGALPAIQNIWFGDISVKSAFFTIKDANGSVDVSPESIRTSGVSFVLNGEPCKLHHLTLSVKKENEIYKISTIEGSFLNSSFEFMGEFENVKGPVLSLYGKANLDIKDIACFAPEEVKKSLKSLNPEGILSNSIYFKAAPEGIQSLEVGIKSNAEFLKIGTFKFDTFQMETRIKDGKVSVPLLNAYPYNGALTSSLEFDFGEEGIPYQISCRLSNIDITALLKNTELKDKDIRGHLFSEFALRGNVKSIDLAEGSGSIFIKDANLGPMPLLTPLLGNLYGYLQHVFPELKKINITKASADFYVANRKVVTDNLILWGEAISVHAKGHIDFDKNLSFEVENKLLEPKEAKADDWQNALQEMIVQFGKLMSKARLTGTLQKPKWEFEYFGGMQNVFKGGLDKIFKDIFE